MKTPAYELNKRSQFQSKRGGKIRCLQNNWQPPFDEFGHQIGATTCREL